MVSVLEVLILIPASSHSIVQWQLEVSDQTNLKCNFLHAQKEHWVDLWEHVERCNMWSAHVLYPWPGSRSFINSNQYWPSMTKYDSNFVEMPWWICIITQYLKFVDGHKTQPWGFLLKTYGVIWVYPQPACCDMHSPLPHCLWSRSRRYKH